MMNQSGEFEFLTFRRVSFNPELKLLKLEIFLEYVSSCWSTEGSLRQVGCSQRASLRTPHMSWVRREQGWAELPMWPRSRTREPWAQECRGRGPSLRAV